MSDIIDEVASIDQFHFTKGKAASDRLVPDAYSLEADLSPGHSRNIAGRIGSDDHPISGPRAEKISASPSTSKPRKKREAETKLPASADDMTDAWHAQRFVDRYVGRLRFCPIWMKWLEYDGRRWHKDNELISQRLALQAVRLLREQLKGMKRQANHEEFIAAIRRAESNRSIAATIKLAQSDERITVKPQDFDQDNFILNCTNGTLDLKTGLLREHDPTDNLTKMTPVRYVDSADCPTWMRFLDRIMAGDQEMIDFLQRALGYSLTGEVKEECMFVLYGLGQNGKSKLLDAVRTIAGDYGGVSESHMLTLKIHSEHPTGIANLAGKRLVVISEPNECRFDEAIVKLLTGGDMITSRKLYKDFSEFMPTHKFFVMSNHKPQVRELSVAYWRRMNLVEFAVTIPPEERDNDLPGKLMSEAEGILAWLVQGCLRWQEIGLAQPAKVLEATKVYRDEMDKIGGFLEARCTEGLGLRVHSSDLWSAY